LEEALFSWQARLGETWRLVRCRSNKGIAFSTLSPAGNDNLCSLRIEISQEFAALGIADQSSQWHTDNKVVTVFPMLILSSAVFATLSPQVALINEIAQGAQLRVGSEDNVPTIAAIPAVWPPSRTVFFAQEADAATAAIPGFYLNSDFINKVHKRVYKSTPFMTA
jgi:hypothetical protein